MFKKFAGALAIIGAVVVAGVVGFQLLDSPFTTTTKDHSPPPVLTELRDLADFHAAQAQFEVTLDLEKDVKWVPSAIAGERVQFVGVGTVDAVVDFSALGAGAVKISDDAKSVVVTLPECIRGCSRARPRSEPRHEPRPGSAQPHRRHLQRQSDE